MLVFIIATAIGAWSFDHGWVIAIPCFFIGLASFFVSKWTETWGPNLLFFRHHRKLPARHGSCSVSFVGVSGIKHSVDVSAETLYEAAALALAMFRESEWADQIAPGTELRVTVRAPETTHSVTTSQIRRWCDGVAVSPDEVLKKSRVRALLG